MLDISSTGSKKEWLKDPWLVSLTMHSRLRQLTTLTLFIAMHKSIVENSNLVGMELQSKLHNHNPPVMLMQIQQPADVRLTDMSEKETNLLKRIYSTRSPSKTTTNCSPHPKKLRRRRTGMEGGSGSTSDSLPPVNIVPTLREALQKPNLDNALKLLREVSYQYMLLKVASTTHNETLINFNTYFSLRNKLTQPERSNIIYFKVLDQRYDDKETLLNIINDI